MKNILTTLVLMGLPLVAQTTLKDSMIKHWQRSADLTIAVAEAMPAESYNFRPTPAEMSFGQLMAHIGAADMSACAAVRGEKAVFPPAIAAWIKDQEKVEVDKEAAISTLKSAFESCKASVAGVTPESLDGIVGTGARAQTRFELLWAYFTHTAHHRGQAEVYLRLKGVKPPSYVF